MRQKQNVSFDFDGCLTLDAMQVMAERCLAWGDNVFIVTTRDPNKDNSVVYEFADDLCIKRENVHFTNHDLKIDTIQRLNIHVHFDDDKVEIDAINDSDDHCCTGILVNYTYKHEKE